MELRVAIRAFLSHRRPFVTAETLAAYDSELEAWCAWRARQGLRSDLAAIDRAEFRAYIEALAARLKPRTVRNHARTLRAFWRWLEGEGEGWLSTSQRGIWSGGHIPLPKIRERERPAVTQAQIDALLRAIGDGDDEQARRDRAIILLLWESGMRAHELAKLRLEDCDLKERTARIIGKGDKEGYVFWGPAGAVALARYVRVRPGPLVGPLFRGCSSRNRGGPVTANLIRLLIKRLAKAAGITLPKGAPVHGFRHGRARELRRRGLSKEEIRDILRHSDIKTTNIYLGLDIEAPRAAHRRAFRIDEQRWELGARES